MSISSIKDWAEEDQPRQKLLVKGRESLSNAELMAILLGTGSKEESAVGLSQRILKSCPNLDDLGRKSLDFFISYKGIGEAKAISIAAALELGRRRQLIEPKKKQKINTSRLAYDLLGPLLKDLPHEEFWIVCLNRANKLISKDRISIGGVHGTSVDAKVIFAQALRQSATSVVLFHNHPSGQIEPSKQDLVLTEKLVMAGKVLDIRVQDHIIVGHEEYFSFIDEGLID